MYAGCVSGESCCVNASLCGYDPELLCQWLLSIRTRLFYSKSIVEQYTQPVLQTTTQQHVPRENRLPASRLRTARGRWHNNKSYYTTALPYSNPAILRYRKLPVLYARTALDEREQRRAFPQLPCSRSAL